MLKLKPNRHYTIFDTGTQLRIFPVDSSSRSSSPSRSGNKACPEPSRWGEVAELHTDIHIPENTQLQYIISWHNLTVNRTITLHLDDPEASAEFLGTIFATEHNTVSLKSTIAHHAPHTTGNCLIKGVITDSAQVNLSGMIQIDHPASNSLDQLTERLLILSPNAFGELHPELEILTNEVRASHATTISRPDPDQLFYLQSRGVSLPNAIELIVEGFLQEVKQNIPLLSNELQ